FVALLSPIRSMYALIYPEQYAIATHAYSSNIPPIVLHLAGMATLSFIFFLTFSFFIFRKTTGQAGKNQEAYTGLEKTIKRKLTFPFYLIDPLKRKKPIGRFRNPVFITELRSKLFGKPKFILRGLALSIIISMCILLLVSTQYGDSLKADYVRMVAVIFQIAMIALLAPAVSSGSITNELTSGTFLLLRTSTISSITVVTGKLKAAFLYVMIFLVSSLPVFLALAYLESTSSYWRVGAWVGVLVIAAILFICAGLFFSSICTKTEVATALSYGFAALICVVTLGGITFSSQLTPYAQTVMLTLNPIVAALQITSDKMFADLPLIMNNPLWQNYLILTGILCIILTLFSAIRVHHIFRKRN
ncbi:MAG: hypothetical protein U9O87_08250, partial [Verrucomicrobiota bacterium]|nr:hypothetical protein [Verrucomicrobiota bacterium]